MQASMWLGVAEKLAKAIRSQYKHKSNMPEVYVEALKDYDLAAKDEKNCA